MSKKEDKREYEVNPTPRQKRAFINLQRLSEFVPDEGSVNRVFDSKKEALMDAGYAESTAKKPKRVQKSKGYQAILKEINFTRDDRLSILARIANDIGEDGVPNDKRSTISAIREGNKMTGDHAPTKVEGLTAHQSINRVIHEVPDKD